MKKQFYYALPLTGYRLSGQFETMEEFFSTFSLWCLQRGLTSSQAIGLWFAGWHFVESLCLLRPEEMENLSDKAFDKLPLQKEGEYLNLTAEKGGVTKKVTRNSGRFLFFKKISYGLSGGNGYDFFPPKNHRHEQKNH